MNITKTYTFYFLGIGGIGMSALARYFSTKGCAVMGYDRTPSPLTKALEEEGIVVQYDDSLDLVQTLDVERTVVVRTPAVPEDMPVYVWLRDNGFRVWKRAEVLGMVTRESRALCVAGTHGKTTTSTILAHVLHQSHIGANAFLGGIANNYQSNLLLDSRSDLVVVEADEFDRSFHHLRPYISVITSVDPDHLDIYGTEDAYRESFAKYASLVENALVVKKGVEHCVSGAILPACSIYTYAVNEEADFYADDVRVIDGEIWFDLHTPQSVVYDLKLGVPAWVNIENSVAALAVAYLMGCEDEEMRNGVASFEGVYRRFNVHVNTTHVAYIDDYAHHPEELRASIESVRRLYGDRHVIGVFQPHLYTRTRDFVDEFAAVLSQLDEAILLPIYPARELPIEGVNSEWLLSKITTSKALVEKSQLVQYVSRRVAELKGQMKDAVVMTMGAGDIDRLVNDITKTLINEKND
jgi:UDP-N-acetylmuramate--alanine ligase